MVTQGAVDERMSLFRIETFGLRKLVIRTGSLYASPWRTPWRSLGMLGKT